MAWYTLNSPPYPFWADIGMGNRESVDDILHAEILTPRHIAFFTEGKNVKVSLLYSVIHRLCIQPRRGCLSVGKFTIREGADRHTYNIPRMPTTTLHTGSQTRKLVDIVMHSNSISINGRSQQTLRLCRQPFPNQHMQINLHLWPLVGTLLHS